MFTPLFDLRDVEPSVYLDPIKRRYNSADRVNNIGSDGWAKKSTIEWLDTNNLRVDDISSIHGARYTTDSLKSILGHFSHTHGNEMDVRYANPIEGIGKIINMEFFKQLSNMDYTTQMGDVLNLMNQLNVNIDIFNYNENIYCNDGSIKKATCKNGNLGYLNGYLVGNGIHNLGDKAVEEINSKSIDVKDPKYDNISEYRLFNTFKDWIITNRLMIQYFKSNMFSFFKNVNNAKIHTGKGFTDSKKDFSFDFSLKLGASAHGKSMGLPLWTNKTIPAAEHQHHWHITLPDRKDAIN